VELVVRGIFSVERVGPGVSSWYGGTKLTSV
jgi:hypothetical protein